MTKASAREIKKLRQATGAGMLDAKAALEEAGGDSVKAHEILRKKGVVKAGKKSERETGQGIVESYIHGDGRIGVLLEVACETDFVARNSDFRSLVHDLALHIAAKAPLYVSSADVPDKIVKKEREILAEAAAGEGKTGKVAGQIVEGRMRKFYEENVLLDQPFVRDEDVTVREVIEQAVAKLGENIRVKRFVRYVLGE